MLNKIKENIEPNKTIKTIEIIVLIFLLFSSLGSFCYGFCKLKTDYGELNYLGSLTMKRDTSLEDCDEDYTVCELYYVNGDKKITLSVSYEEYQLIGDDSITVYEYTTNDDIKLYFDHLNPGVQEIKIEYEEVLADRLMPIFNLGNALFILAISLSLMLLFGKIFTTYEKIWFLSIMVLSTIFAVIFPEESANGVSGIWIMLLYLIDTFLNILCELLISKQSRYNFIVSVLVEITEIVICLVLMYRFATMAVTLFFWLPIDIISFINWSKHKDVNEDELTAVRKLKGYQEVLVIIGIIVFTVVVGYFLSGLDIKTDFFNNNKSLETAVIYIDACASAVGIANGLFILFRLREQWIAWFISAILEATINIISGQYVLLVLKVGYLTNCTYGFIKWSKYIKTHKQNKSFL